MSGYLLDSDVIIWFLRGRQDVIGVVRTLEREGPMSCSVISIMEIEVGIRETERARTYGLLDSLIDYPISKEIARRAGSYMRDFRSRGVTLNFADSLIAAAATVEDLTLVTLNARHYPMRDVALYEWPSA